MSLMRRSPCSHTTSITFLQCSYQPEFWWIWRNNVCYGRLDPLMAHRPRCTRRADVTCGTAEPDLPSADRAGPVETIVVPYCLT